MKLIGYVRVSTDKQSNEGVSLEAQQTKIEMYCELYGHELVRVETDAGQSASSLDRPSLQNALDALSRSEADGLIVVKLDRLTRSVVDLGKLLTGPFKNSELISVSENVDSSNATGRLILNILMSVSQWEREVIGERTSDALRHKQSKGEYIGGGIPYGYAKADGDLVEVPEEQEVIQHIISNKILGMSNPQSARHLKSLGIVSRKQKPFHPEQIRRILNQHMESADEQRHEVTTPSLHLSAN